MTNPQLKNQTSLFGIEKLRVWGDKIMLLSIYGLYCALAVIYFWFGGMKFTQYEAQGLVPLVSNSPVVGWTYEMLSVGNFSSALGYIEVLIGALILGRIVSPKISLLGGVLSVGLFLTTISFMFSTPGVIEEGLGFPAITVSLGQFLLKDVALLAVSIFIVGHSLSALESKDDGFVIFENR
ncbi:MULTISPECIES: YkgB family protein [Pseudomonas]|uniref:YkgB family protein n=1 Tax=Pseudomonas TaxID=286 RepID=UPI000702FD3F|nr:MULTISPECIES: DUF417 family protein [Pseudomonas]KQZ86842.1 hypothetical protein ASD60_05260 [Pseudomonas sp. Root562]